MTLQEKILYYRKKSGLSQEALSEQIGVSRQAVSKWETGEAVPEINKILLLAKVFNVTTDSLLSEEVPIEDTTDTSDFVGKEQMGNTWVDSIPGVIGRLLRRYGWLFGVYLAVSGMIFIFLGAMARLLSNNMMDSIPFDTPYFDNAGSFPDVELLVNNPVSIMGSVIVVIGVVMLVSGVVLAVLLKRISKKQL